MLEKLTCQRLLQATFSVVDSIIITHVTAAVLMIEPQAKRQNIEGLDFNLFHKLTKLNSSFNGVTSFKDSYGESFYSVPWSFPTTPENFKAYIEPWYQNNIEFCKSYIKVNLTQGRRVFHDYSSLSERCSQRLTVFNPTKEKSFEDHIKFIVPDICPKCGEEIYRKDLDYENVLVVDYNAPKWCLFYEASGCLTHTGLNNLKTNFETYAKTYSLNAINVLSNLVSPNVFDEMMKLFVKTKGEDKGVRSNATSRRLTNEGL